MLDLGVCRRDYIVLGISARSHRGRDAGTRWSAWTPVAKLSVNAMIGLWAQHGGGLQRAQQQQRAGRRGRGLLQAHEGGMVWDFVYARRLLSNGT